jgi:hypothetical protein
MTATRHPTDVRNSHYERIFVGDKCIIITHFYSIGSAADPTCPVQPADWRPGDGPEYFAYGYWDYSGAFRQGIAKWDGEQF